MNNAAATNPESIQPVTVRRHHVDWEASDLDLTELTARRALSLGPKLQQGCWYLCPRFTVSCPAPTAAFFRTVLELRSSWLRTCRQVQGNYGQRQQARQAERQGRLGAHLSIDPDAAAGLPCRQRPKFVPPPARPGGQRRGIIEAGQIAKQLGFGGIMFIDGNPIPPQTWQAQADRLLRRSKDAPITTTRRHVDLAAFKTSGDPEPLKQTAREALQAHLDASESHAAFVTPMTTISASTATPAFYEAAQQAQARWCILLNRTLGCGNVRRLRRASDPATLCLAFFGTLLVDGRAYLPQCWPIHAPKLGRLKRTPFGSPTVPPEFLGLSLPNTKPGPEGGDGGVNRPGSGIEPSE